MKTRYATAPKLIRENPVVASRASSASRSIFVHNNRIQSTWSVACIEWPHLSRTSVLKEKKKEEEEEEGFPLSFSQKHIISSSDTRRVKKRACRAHAERISRRADRMREGAPAVKKRRNEGGIEEEEESLGSRSAEIWTADTRLTRMCARGSGAPSLFCNVFSRARAVHVFQTIPKADVLEPREVSIFRACPQSLKRRFSKSTC